MIPRIVHQIWMQGKQYIPDRYTSARNSWPQTNPKLKLVIWDEVDAAALVQHTEWENVIEKCDTLIQRADVYRCAILEKYGGIYIDMDMHAIKALEPLLIECDESICEVFIGYTSFQNTPLHYLLANNNAFIAAKQNSTLWPKLRNECLKRLHAKTLLDALSPIHSVIKTTGPGLWTHLAKEKTVKSLPREYFYSLRVIKGVNTLSAEDVEALKPFSYCYHTQAASWIESWESLVLYSFVGHRWKITLSLLSLLLLILVSLRLHRKL
jgi:mannosyltransferase OCH1-like enzyme